MTSTLYKGHYLNYMVKHLLAHFQQEYDLHFFELKMSQAQELQ